jgi:hypothetical protein
MSLAMRLVVGLSFIAVGLIARGVTHGGSGSPFRSHPKDSVVRVRTNNADIVAAKAKAQVGLDRFFTRLKNPYYAVLR